jgi:tetratricopeptide (TPR) repeat protein
MNDLECRNELVARERRGELSPAERVALDAHFGHCASCRLSRLLGRDFDAEAKLETDDGARIAGLSALAERWAAGRVGPVPTVPLKRRRVRIALLAVAAVLAAVGASAARGTFSEMFGSSESEPSRASAPVPAPPRERANPGAERTLGASNGESNVAREAFGPRTRASQAPTESAASLFKDASSARRTGDAERAIALYRRLQNDFPSSPEAGLATLPLGGLLLDRGEARSALTQFDRHVRGAPSSRLLPEALYGRGRSLAALGNRSEEQRTWSRLLDQFPESPYAGHARRRLSELKPGD